MTVYSVEKLMAETRRLAAEYRRMTGKTLAVSGEIAISDAIRLLDLKPAPDDECDAIQQSADATERLQIKGRVVFDESKGGHRLGQLRLDRDWDKTLLVLMDENYEPYEIYEALRDDLEQALSGKSVNKRGAMSVAQFKILSELLWVREYEPEADAATPDRKSV